MYKELPTYQLTERDGDRMVGPWGPTTYDEDDSYRNHILKDIHETIKKRDSILIARGLKESLSTNDYIFVSLKNTHLQASIPYNWINIMMLQQLFKFNSTKKTR